MHELLNTFLTIMFIHTASCCMSIIFCVTTGQFFNERDPFIRVTIVRGPRHETVEGHITQTGYFLHTVACCGRYIFAQFE
jgi:hypothetical protein